MQHPLTLPPSDRGLPAVRTGFPSGSHRTAASPQETFDGSRGARRRRPETARSTFLAALDADDGSRADVIRICSSPPRGFPHALYGGVTRMRLTRACALARTVQSTWMLGVAPRRMQRPDSSGPSRQLSSRTLETATGSQTQAGRKPTARPDFHVRPMARLLPGQTLRNVGQRARHVRRRRSYRRRTVLISKGRLRETSSLARRSSG